MPLAVEKRPMGATRPSVGAAIESARHCLGGALVHSIQACRNQSLGTGPIRGYRWGIRLPRIATKAKA